MSYFPCDPLTLSFEILLLYVLFRQFIKRLPEIWDLSTTCLCLPGILHFLLFNCVFLLFLFCFVFCFTISGKNTIFWKQHEVPWTVFDFFAWFSCIERFPVLRLAVNDADFAALQYKFWSDVWNVSYIELRIWNQVSYDHRSHELVISRYRCDVFRLLYAIA